MIRLNRIDKDAFHHQAVPMLFGENDDRANNHFAMICNDTHSFKFAWNSDIEPIVKEIISNVYGIGIDQHFSIIDFNSGNILLNLNLFYNFYNIEGLRNFILVITELEIIKINLTGFVVTKTYALPEYFEGIEFKEGSIAVKCINGEVINIE